MNKRQPSFLIVLLFVLASMTAGYSQNGAVFNALQPVVLRDASGHSADINDEGQLHVVLRGAVDPLNSTVVPVV